MVALDAVTKIPKFMIRQLWNRCLCPTATATVAAAAVLVAVAASEKANKKENETRTKQKRIESVLQAICNASQWLHRWQIHRKWLRWQNLWCKISYLIQRTCMQIRACIQSRRTFTKREHPNTMPAIFMSFFLMQTLHITYHVHPRKCLSAMWSWWLCMCLSL